ncbi:unnamed protein product [Brassica rapa]|uniref:Uncharacterized protein n=2 Tax=Brassica campestris TaxID=3711 RepID=A0A8D9GU33_BRACM|nr:unnamed protein product [Brassica rapa]
MSFAYDRVPLLAMLDEYMNVTCDKPMFCLNKQEQKKVQEQPHVEQDIAFSTRPSPARPVSAKKPVGARASNGGANGRPNRRLSLNANQNGSRSVAKEGGRSVCNFAFVNLKISIYIHKLKLQPYYDLFLFFVVLFSWCIIG